MQIVVNDAVMLETTDHHHAKPLLDVLNRNRDHLREWLPWVDDMQTVDSFHNYIESCKAKEETNSERSFVITYQIEVAGRIGLHYFDHHNKTCKIGYWLGKEFIGKGIIIESCKKLIEYAFMDLGFNRIEIKCGTGNYKSAAIPEKLNFTREGILRQAEWVNDRCVDLYLFSLLKEDYLAIKKVSK